MKRSTNVLLLLLVSIWVFGQSDPQTGWYMANPANFNPAAIGENDLLRAYASHRIDYAGIRNAPMTTFASFSMPFQIGKTRHAAGIRFMNDSYGLWTNQALHVQYAFRIKAGKGYLSVGPELGFVNIGFKGDSVNLSQLTGDGTGGDYFDSSDPYVPKSSVSGMGFDMAVGLYYYSPKWFVGASYSHLTQPKVTWTANAESGTDIITRLKGTLFVSGGYNYRCKRDKKFELKPSAMVMTDFAGWDINLTFLTQYNDRWRWGLGYRIAGSIEILLGVDIIDGLQLGYTWEIQHSRLMTEGYGSHEIYLSYGINLMNRKLKGAYKSVRYL